MDTAAPLQLQGVVHLIRPTGATAWDLDQLRTGIAEAPERALFHHAVQNQLRAPSGEELPPDDFSLWVGAVVQDRETAERLSFTVQARDRTAADLRAGLLEVLDAVPARARALRDAPEEGGFVFLTAESVALPMGDPVADPPALVEALIAADASVWFYHFVEEPWFADGGVSLIDWLAARHETRLAAWARDAVEERLPLEALRRKLARRWRQSRLGRRVAEAAEAASDSRRRAGHDAVSRLVRRMTRPEPPS